MFSPVASPVVKLVSKVALDMHKKPHSSSVIFT